LSHTSSPFCFNLFFREGILPGPASDHNPPNYASCIATLTDMNTVSCLFVDIGSHFLPRLASNCDLPHLYLLNSWDYRCKPLHQTQVLAFECEQMDLGPAINHY
jgi:hypothetical protein